MITTAEGRIERERMRQGRESNAIDVVGVGVPFILVLTLLNGTPFSVVAIVTKTMKYCIGRDTPISRLSILMRTFRFRFFVRLVFYYIQWIFSAMNSKWAIVWSIGMESSCHDLRVPWTWVIVILVKNGQYTSDNGSNTTMATWAQIQFQWTRAFALFFFLSISSACKIENYEWRIFHAISYGTSSPESFLFKMCGEIISGPSDVQWRRKIRIAIRVLCARIALNIDLLAPVFTSLQMSARRHCPMGARHSCRFFVPLDRIA